MKRIGWIFCAAALFAANPGIAEEAPPPVAPTEMTAPSFSAAPGADDAGSAVPAPPAPPSVAPAEAMDPSFSAAPEADDTGSAVPAPPAPPVPGVPPPAPPAPPAPVFPAATFPLPSIPVPPVPPAPSPAPAVPSPGGAAPLFGSPPSPAPPPAVSPFRRQPVAPALSPSAGTGPGFFVKFNNADIYEVIHTLGRTAGINYLIDPRVRGVVNVHTQGVVRKEGALDLLFAILRVNGATAVKEGDTYHIIPMTEAKSEPILPSFPGDNAAKASSNQVLMRAFPLQYIAVAEMAKVIKPFLSTGGEAVEVARANILLGIDTWPNLVQTERLVEFFDSEVFRAAGM